MSIVDHSPLLRLCYLGRFLWVFFQIEELSDPSHSKHTFQATLQDLPQGLNETYESILLKIEKKSPRQITFAKKVFDWTLAARRPLALSELQEAVAIGLSDKFWDKSKISTEPDGRQFLENCGALVVFDELSDTVRLAHHTVAQFFEENCKRRHGRRECDLLLGDTCLTYLMFTDFETQITLRDKTCPPVKWNASNQVPFYYILQLLGISKGIFDYILRIYHRGDRTLLPDIDYQDLMRKFEKAPVSAPMDQKYRLLGYVRQNWIWHVRQFTRFMPERWRQFRDMVFNKKLVFEFRPWPEARALAGLPYLMIFLWALETAHEPLLFLLQESAPLADYVRVATESYIGQIIRRGAIDIFRLLVKEEKLIASNDRLMCDALLSRQVDILSIMLDEGSSSANAHFLLKERHDDMGDPLGYSKRPGKGDTGLTATHIAAYNGDKKMLILLLDKGAGVDGTDSSLRTPLFYACCHVDGVSDIDNLEILKILLSRGAAIDTKDCDGETALQKTLRQKDRKSAIVKELLAQGASVHSRNCYREDILETAILHAPENLQYFKGRGLNFEARDEQGFTPLLRSMKSWRVNEDRVMGLILAGADVKVQDSSRKTPLHMAAEKDMSLAVVKCLVEHGADVHARNVWGRLALDIAVDHRNVKMVQTFMQSGVGINAHHPDWEPPIFHMIRHGYTAKVATLLACGGDPDTTDHGNPPKSALTCSAIFNMVEIAKMLIRCGAKVRPEIWDKECDSFYWAVIKGYMTILRLLFSELSVDKRHEMWYLWDYLGWISPHNT